MFFKTFSSCIVVHDDVQFFRKRMLLDQSCWDDVTSTGSILDASAATAELCIAILEMYPNDDAWNQAHPLPRFHAATIDVAVEVKTSDSLQPTISNFCMKPLVYALSAFLWLAGFIAMQVAIFDASKIWWVVVIAAWNGS